MHIAEIHVLFVGLKVINSTEIENILVLQYLIAHMYSLLLSILFHLVLKLFIIFLLQLILDVFPPLQVHKQPVVDYFLQETLKSAGVQGLGKLNAEFLVGQGCQCERLDIVFVHECVEVHVFVDVVSIHAYLLLEQGVHAIKDILQNVKITLQVLCPCAS